MKAVSSRLADSVCWPDPAQRLLLRAALGPDAGAAWTAWTRSCDIDAIDPGAYRLIPLVYQNLRQAGADGSSFATLRGIYRHTWTRNNVLAGMAGALLDGLARASIPTVMLKELVLLCEGYESAGLRPTYHFSLLIRPTDSIRAAAALARDGWKQMPEPPSGRTDLLAPGRTVWRQPSGPALHLRTTLFGFPGAAEDEMFWQAATIRHILGVATPAADLETVLLQICVEGLQWDEVAPLQWIADAAMLVRRCPLDWGRLIDLARAHRKVHTLREALGFLNAEMHIAIPAGPLSALRAEPADPTEIEELALALGAPRPSDVVALLRGLRTLHRKEARWRSQAAGWLEFRRFLLRRWGNGVRAGLTRLALAKLYATLARRGG